MNLRSWMNTPSREETLFQSAAQLAGPERATFLDRESAGDPALRARLEALLAAHDAPDGVLASHAEVSRPAITLDLPEVNTVSRQRDQRRPDQAVHR